VMNARLGGRMAVSHKRGLWGSRKRVGLLLFLPIFVFLNYTKTNTHNYSTHISRRCLNESPLRCSCFS
jgi:hypothetical protein